MLLKKKKIRNCINYDTEIYSDSDEENFGEENSGEENSDV